MIVRDKTILSTGYNGSIRGMPHCTEAGHMMENDHCVATVHAESRSDNGTDPGYWNWVGAVTAWMGAMAAWQSGVRHAVSAWAPAPGTDQALRNALLQLGSPGPVPAPPTAITGKLQ